MEPPTITVRTGEDARFDCSARSHIEVEAIEWTMDGGRLPAGDNHLVIVKFGEVYNKV